jgi:hypothetical protein
LVLLTPILFIFLTLVITGSVVGIVLCGIILS